MFIQVIKRKFKRIISIIKGDRKYLVSDKVELRKKWYGNTYGGFYVAPQFLNSESIVYSFGIGEDISFDSAIINEHNCLVFGFDPTPKSVKWVEKQASSTLEKFRFFDYGIAEQSGKVDFFLPKNNHHISGSIVVQDNVSRDEIIQVEMKSLKDISIELGHSKINVLKIDIEGGEYLVIDDILQSEIIVDQILIEFHDRFFPDGRSKTINTITMLRRYGYKVFGVSDSFEEISFIHSSLLG